MEAIDFPNNLDDAKMTKKDVNESRRGAEVAILCPVMGSNLILSFVL